MTKNVANYLDIQRETFDRNAAIYDSRLITDYEHAIEWRTIRSRLHHVFDATRPVLDAGCGTGRFTERLTRLGARVVGCDFSIQSLRIARQRVDAGTFVEADVRHLPFSDGVFQQGLCSQVFPHVVDHDDAVAALRELRRVICPDSRLIITVFNYRLVTRLKDWLRLPDRGRRWSAYGRLGVGPNASSVFFTKRQFRDVLSEVFAPNEIAGVWAIVNFKHKPLAFGRNLTRPLWPFIIRADMWAEHTPLARWFGHLWLAEIVKRKS